MFGIRFQGHPHMERILMPRTWEGHSLLKDDPGRATEMVSFPPPDEKEDTEQRFQPEKWGMRAGRGGMDFMFLNFGPQQQPGTRGVLRVALQLDGEQIVDAVPQIGFYHRGAEKMGERQSWHTYVPYTDRIGYLGGVMNNMAYLMAVEKLAGIEVPLRTKVIRVMLAELFRIVSHLLGTELSPRIWGNCRRSSIHSTTANAHSPSSKRFAEREFTPTAFAPAA
jgi:NADH-quinone oxidoreductase subunit C/D